MCAGVRLSHDWQRYVTVRHGTGEPSVHPVHTLYSCTHPVHWSPSRTSWDRQSFTRVQSSLTRCPLRRRTPCHLHLAAALLDNVPLYITVHCASHTRHGTHNIMGWSMETPSPGPTIHHPNQANKHLLLWTALSTLSSIYQMYLIFHTPLGNQKGSSWPRSTQWQHKKKRNNYLPLTNVRHPIKLVSCLYSRSTALLSKWIWTNAAGTPRPQFLKQRGY